MGGGIGWVKVDEDVAVEARRRALADVNGRNPPVRGGDEHVRRIIGATRRQCGRAGR